MTRFFALLLWLGSMQALAVPAVSSTDQYQDICRNCVIHPDTGILQCQCPDNKGIFSQQKLDIAECDGRVEFRGGYLLCNTGSEDTTLEDSESMEQPAADSGHMGAFELDLPEAVDIKTEQDIEDDIGPDAEIEPLSWFWKKRDPNLPPGDYGTYCKSCSVSNGELSCMCKLSSGFGASGVRAWIRPGQCANRAVSYAQGRLVCASDVLGLLGSSNTCNSCTIKGAKLSCNCKRTSCQWSDEDIKAGHLWKKTSLKNARFCTETIHNCNGNLTCGECGIFSYLEEFTRPYKGKQTRPSCKHW